MFLCVCSTPLQVMNAINLRLSILKTANIDLIVLNHSDINVQIYKKLKESNIFNGVYFVDSKGITAGNSECKIIRYLIIAGHFLNGRRIVSQLKNRDIRYDNYIICSPDIPSKIIYYYFKKCNAKMKLYMLEEGTYAYNYFGKTPSLAKDLFEKMVFRNNILKDYVGAYVYKPEYILGQALPEIVKLPSIDKQNIEIVKIMNQIFLTENFCLADYNNETIFFDQPFAFRSVNDSVRRILDNILNLMPSSERIIIKLHPRSNKSICCNNLNIMDTKISFEIINLNNNLDNKLLISVFSTACITPKIIYDEEPIVILLFKLIDLSQITHVNSETFELAYKVQSDYRNSDRFFIPESIEELEKAFQKIFLHIHS